MMLSKLSIEYRLQVTELKQVHHLQAPLGGAHLDLLE
jgi:hypothetical protein